MASSSLVRGQDMEGGGGEVLGLNWWVEKMRKWYGRGEERYKG
jgi:hypothetical protein